MLDTKKLADHVGAVAQSFRIRLDLDESLDFEEAKIIYLDSTQLTSRLHIALTGCRAILRAHPIIDEATYAVVMHEIGHAVAPNGICTHRKPKPGCHPRDRFAYLAARLVCEEAAWEWAEHLVRQTFPWTASMEAVKRYALGTYQEARRGYR